MKTSQYLINFYNHYDEDSRLALKHGPVEFLTAMRFAAKSEPKDLSELVRKENIDELMSVFPVTRLHYVAADGCALFMREAADAMDNDGRFLQEAKAMLTHLQVVYLFPKFRFSDQRKTPQ